jgi:hypothetical protein
MHLFYFLSHARCHICIAAPNVAGFLPLVVMFQYDDNSDHAYEKHMVHILWFISLSTIPPVDVNANIEL